MTDTGLTLCTCILLSGKRDVGADLGFEATSLLGQHRNTPLLLSLRLAMNFILAHMRPTVPSIDFKPFLCGSASDRLRIASEIDEALSSVGFIQLHNHGIKQHKVDACFQWVC